MRTVTAVRWSYVVAAISGPPLLWLYGQPTWANRPVIVHGGIAHLIPSALLYVVGPAAVVCLAMAATRPSFWTNAVLEVVASAFLCTTMISFALFYHIESAAELHGAAFLDAQALLVGVTAAVGVGLAAVALVRGRPGGTRYLLARMLHAVALCLLAWCLAHIGAALYMTTRASSAPSIAVMVTDMQLRAIVFLAAAALLGASEGVRRLTQRLDARS